MIPLFAISLPDPKDYASIGWVVVVIFLAVKGLDGVFDFYKKHVKQTIPPAGDWVTRAEMILAITECKTSLATTKLDLEQQIKDVRAYAHEEVHRLGDEVGVVKQDSRNGLEGFHNRINALMELTHHMRGQLESVLEGARASSAAAVSAAGAAERAAAAVESLSLHRGPSRTNG